MNTLVPRLRTELVVSRGAAPGLFELYRPGVGPRLVLYDFELSVARMLDGRRSTADLVENAERLGIPVDPPGLARFLDLLERHGFLAEPGTEPGPGALGGRPPRRPWDAETRERFRDGVRLVRQGRPDDAVPSFQAVLARDPENPEAKEMLALVAAGHALAARPIGEVFDRPLSLPPPARPRHQRLLLVAGISLLAAAGILGAKALVSPDPPPQADARWPGQPTAPAGAERGGPVAPPPAAATPPAPDAATAAGALLASSEAAPILRRWHPLAAEVRAPASGRVAWREPDAARTRPGQPIGEVRVAEGAGARGAEARQRLAELERLAAADPVYQEFLDRERAVLRGEEARLRPAPIAAPAAGRLSLEAREGAPVAAGAVVARIMDVDTWRAIAVVRGAAPADGAPCELAGADEGQRTACRVVEVQPAEAAGGGRAGAEAFAVTVEVAARAAPWLAHARSPVVRLPRGDGALARQERP